jgi:hypothetical protein
MSRSGEITLAFGDRDRTFRLTIEAWEKVQEKCDAGPAEILSRLAPVFAARAAKLSYGAIVANGLMGSWRVHDVREVLLRGLQFGEKISLTDAGRVIRDVVDSAPLLESVCAAYEVVAASILGADDEPVGEPQGGEATTTSLSPEERSGSPPTTETAP